MQELFLEMASEMPALRSIVIMAAPPGWACGAAIFRQRQSLQRHITKTVDRFGEARGSLALSHLIENHHRRVEEITAARLFW